MTRRPPGPILWGRPAFPRCAAFPSSAVPSGAPIANPQPSIAPALLAPATRRVVLAVATCAGAGLVPAIPGTCGAALGVALFLLFAPAPVWLLALTWLGLLALGVWTADVAGRIYEREDDARIVIDEVAGQLLALAPLLSPLVTVNYWSVVTAFVLFRCFDISKMWPVGWVERRVRGGLGVMLDDLVAGAVSACILLLLALLTPLGRA